MERSKRADDILLEKKNAGAKRTLPRHGTPGGIRTHDPLIRSQVLYPAELRARTAFDACLSYHSFLGNARVNFKKTDFSVKPHKLCKNGSARLRSVINRAKATLLLCALRRAKIKRVLRLQNDLHYA